MVALQNLLLGDIFKTPVPSRQPIDPASGLYKRLENGRYKGRMVPHGWRSAFSTLMNERAALLDRHGDRPVIDMALGHVPKGLSSSEWVYNRARYHKPRAALHDVWGGMITNGLCSPAELLVAYREREGDMVVRGRVDEERSACQLRIALGILLFFPLSVVAEVVQSRVDLPSPTLGYPNGGIAGVISSRQ